MRATKLERNTLTTSESGPNARTAQPESCNLGGVTERSRGAACVCCVQESTADDGEEDNPLFAETGREAGADPVSPGRDARYLGEDTGSGPAPRTVGGREQMKGTSAPPIWAPCPLWRHTANAVVSWLVLVPLSDL